MPELLATRGPLFGARFHIDREVTFGRTFGATIQLPDRQVSRLHAIIREQDGVFSIADASSRNGTFINGRRLTVQAVLNPGDVVGVGRSCFVFEPSIRCLPSPEKDLWVIVGGHPWEDKGGSEKDNPSPPPPSNATLALLRFLSDTVMDEAQVVHQVLRHFMDRFKASAGALFILEANRAFPWAISGNHPHLSLNTGVYTRISAGMTLQIDDILETYAIAEGVPTCRRERRAAISAGWRSEGRPAGALYLEREGGIDAFPVDAALQLEGDLNLLAHLLESSRSRTRNHRRRMAVNEQIWGERIPGERLLEAVGASESAQRLAQGTRAISIVGPRGVGKNRVARVMHSWSRRADGPLVFVNCARLADDMAELRLFGAEADALPGLNTPQAGALELASRGTLVLELVDALPSTVQSALHLALCRRRGVRIGRRGESFPLEARIIVTSTRPLAELAQIGNILPELVTQLNTDTLLLPALSSLSDQLVSLAMDLIGRLNYYHGRQVRGLSPRAVGAIRSRKWPLNVWELEDLLIRAMALSESTLLTLEDLECAEYIPTPGAPPFAPGQPAALTKESEERVIIQALRLAKGHRGEAADLLGIPRDKLELKLVEYSIDWRNP